MATVFVVLDMHTLIRGIFWSAEKAETFITRRCREKVFGADEFYWQKWEVDDDGDHANGPD
jgi:hypothetical protein